MKLRTEVSVIVLAVTTSALASPTIIDFEGQGLAEAQPVGSIGLAMFDGDAAQQGAPTFAFVGPGGPDTGTLPQFSSSGNTFLTNAGGGLSSTTIKTIRVDFAQPVHHLSFLVCDIDAGGTDNIEQFTAEAFDGSNTSLAVIQHTAPLGGGNGVVTKIDFGALPGIRALTLTLENIGDPDITALGMGIDNIQFEISAIPAMSPSGVGFTALLLIALGTVLLRRRGNMDAVR